MFLEIELVQATKNKNGIIMLPIGLEFKERKVYPLKNKNWVDKSVNPTL